MNASENPFITLLGSEKLYWDVATWIRQENHIDEIKNRIEYYFQCRQEGIGH